MAIQGRSNIWQMQSRGDVEGIIEALQAPDSKIRSRAVMAIRAMGAADAIPHLEALQSREPRPEIRAMISDTLKLLTEYAPRQTPKNTDERREALLHELRGPEESRIRRAIRELGKLGDLRATEHLVLIFQDHKTYSPNIRLEAAEALILLESAPASAALLKALRKPDWQVRRNAVAVLGHFRADWAVLPIMNLMHEDPHPTVRRTAIAALRRIDSPAAQAALQHLSKAPTDLLDG